MKKLLYTPTLIITALMTVVLVYLMADRKVELSAMIIGGILFFLLNYAILTLMVRAMTAILRTLRLPGLKVKTYAYHLYPVAMLVLYAAFLIIMARLAKIYVSPYILVGFVLGGAILMILAQLGGAFPDRRISPRKTAIRLESAGGMLGGFEILGSLVGEYRDGLVMGVDAIPYSLIEKMHRSKDSIIIEGTDENKLELIIVAEKAQNYFIDLLAERLGIKKDLLAYQVTDKKALREKADKKAKERQRTKPVKLIEAQEEARRQAQARSRDAQGRP